MPTTHAPSKLRATVTQEGNMQVTTRTKKTANMQSDVTSQMQLHEQHKFVVKMQQRHG